MKSKKRKLPGSIWINGGRYNWRVTLPGSEKRQNYKLIPSGSSLPLHGSKDISLAESIAWQMWNDAVRRSVNNPGVHKKRPTQLSMSELCDRYTAWAESYYKRADGSQTGEAANVVLAIRHLSDELSSILVNDVEYVQILNIRNGMVSSGKLNRETINSRVGVWKRMFEWALDQRLCSPLIKSEVCAISPIKAHRTTAKEGKGRKPVPHWAVKATLPFMPPALQAMVKVHELTGMRPSDLIRMKPCNIEKKIQGYWAYTPELFKTQYHSNAFRVIVLGPKAIEILKPIIKRTDKNAYLFKPVDLVIERNKIKRDSRKTKVQPSQVNRAKHNPKNKPRDQFDIKSYRQAVKYATVAAQKAGIEVPHWTPGQLRHSAGTRIRKRYGSEAAVAVLGHTDPNTPRITDRYTRDAIVREYVKKASKVMLEIG